MPELEPTNTSQSEMTPEEIRSYLSSHQVLNLVHRALNMAVRDRAPNPLLHMARSLRNEWELNHAAGQQQMFSCHDLMAPSSVDVSPESAAAPNAPAIAHARAESPALPASLSNADSPSSAMEPAAKTWLQSASGEGRLELLAAPSEASQLRALLSEGGVDTSEWGSSHGMPQLSAARSVCHLLAELKAGESSLCRAEDGGGLRRIVSFCEVELRLRGRVLVLTHEEVDRACTALCAASAQLRAGEVWQDAARRALREDSSAFHICRQQQRRRCRLIRAARRSFAGDRIDGRHADGVPCLGLPQLAL